MTDTLEALANSALGFVISWAATLFVLGYYAQPDLFVAPPKPPTQEGFGL